MLCQGMDLSQLETFVAIAQLGSFSRAAAKLHRSQPALSRRLSLLEAEIGAPLFERIRRRVQLTDAGRALRPHAEAALAAARDAMAAVREELGQGGGTVSLGIVGTLIDAALAAKLKRFTGGAGSARLSLTTTSSEAVSELVRQGEVVIGVRYFLDRGADVQCMQVGCEQMVVVSSPGRHTPSRKKGSASPVGRTRWVGFSKGRSMREHFGRLLDERLKATGIEDASVMIVDSLSAQKRLVEAGFGLGFLPYSSVRRELTDGTLVVVDMPGVAIDIPVSIVHRRNGYLSPAATALISLLRDRWARPRAERQRASSRASSPSAPQAAT